MKPLLLNEYLRKRFGSRVQRIPLDADLGCPNRLDGKGGCIFCDDKGSSAPWITKGMSIEEQLELGASIALKRYGAKKYIAYFQAYTNTHADCESLDKLYSKVLSFPGLVGLAISTRPDSISDEVIDLLKRYSRKTYLWLELGAQSMLEKSLKWMSRGHSATVFSDAVSRLKKNGIESVGHIIFGLPTETKAETLDSFKSFIDTGINGFKIHALHIIKGTVLEKMYMDKPFSFMTKEEYIELVREALKLTPSGLVVHRLTGEVPKERLIAPDWVLKKEELLRAILSQ